MSERQEMIILYHCVIWRKNYYLFIFCFAFLQKDIVYVPLSCPKYVFVTSDTVTPSVTLSGWREGRGKGVWGVWKSGWNGFWGAADGFALFSFSFLFFEFSREWLCASVYRRVEELRVGGSLWYGNRFLIYYVYIYKVLCFSFRVALGEGQ